MLDELLQRAEQGRVDPRQHSLFVAPAVPHVMK